MLFHMNGTSDFASKYGPWGIVAGGSEGLGAAFAEELAARGLNLLLVARRQGALEDVAGKLRKAHGVEVRTLALDLADARAVGTVEKAAADLDVGLLVCNAAVAYTGPFLRPALSEYQRILDVNCRSSLGLAYTQSKKMAARHKGGIIVMSSMAAFQGSPMVAVYGASKAFLLALAEAMADELEPEGVDVLACCPAVVRTPQFLSDGHNPNGPAPFSMEPFQVAREAVAGLGRKRIVVPGTMPKMIRFMMGHLMPRAAVVGLLGRSTRAMYKERV
jgi:uncharacterized protein